MGSVKRKGRIIIPADVNPWPQELRVARILAHEGYKVEFLAESKLRTPDIKLNGIEFEIKSPEFFNPNTLEHKIKDALKQSRNIIIDSSRIGRIRDDKIKRFLIGQAQRQKQIKKMLFVTKRGKIIDISRMI